MDSSTKKDGSTALHLAASLSDEAECLKAAKVLLSYGANPNIPNKEGKTSVHIAASMGYSRLLDLLLVNGGDPLLGDIMGQSPVDCAHHHHHPEVVQQISKLLDTENYGGFEEHSLKFALFFLRQEVVELMNFSPGDISESDDTFYSCDPDTQLEKDHGCSQSLVSRENWNVVNDWNVTLQELLSQQSISAKQSEKNEVTKTDKDDQQAHVEVKSTFYPIWLKKLDFLKNLKREVQRCYSDSDSDSDIRSLRKCLGKELKHGSLPHHHSFDFFQEEFGSGVDSLDELNTAHMTIDVTHDTVSDTEDDMPHDNCIPANASSNSLLDEWCNISDSVLDEDKTLECDNEFNFTSANVTLQQDQTDLMNQEMTSHNVSQYSLVETPGEAQEFYGGAFADLTALQDRIKPDACTTLNLIKAPRKKRSHISKNHENILTIKKQLTRDYDEFSEKASSSFNYKPDEDCTQKQKVSSAQSTPQSTIKSSTKTVHSSGSSCQSFVSVVEEFLYEDAEAGVQLIERRCPTLAVVANLSSTGSRVSVLTRHPTSQKPTLEHAVSDKSLDSVGTISESVKAMNADELRLCLKNLGHVPGPIVPTTHRTYQRLLLKLRKNPHRLHQYNPKSPQYPLELQAALKDPLSVDWESWASLEKVLSALFSQCDPTRHWRDGTNKTCFNYLLLDPRVTQDLPLRGSVMDEKEKLHCFISAIFYVGKGSRGRPYYHLYEAIKGKDCGTQLSDKIKRIHEIWSEGVGVVSLNVFQNTIPVEAWTREACMISAIGLQNLCNSIQGTFYGLPSTWRWAERRRLGTHLLRRTLNIFMQEGERQLRPSDFTLPTWMK